MRRFFVWIVIIPFVILLSSCPSPAGPEGDTPSLPLAPKYVDDFEDNSKENAINFWICNSNPPQSNVTSFDTTSTPPGIGDYTLELKAALSAKVETSPGNWYGNLPMNTGSTAGANPMDITGYNKIAFSISFEETAALSSGASIEVILRLNGVSGSVIRYDLLNDFQSTFTEYTIPLTDFTVAVGSLSDLKNSVSQISYTFEIWGAGDDSVGFTFILDELRFEE